ncbi:TMEM175 family protein [Dermatobacter hominis]|uniref:TMEM175 family protein n=1 Tax=Dermatobacter hominis TaxID=2884263 RepID=UPI001D11561F|nr:TMEM175 family protein [Dermatobacter hominis]UDY34209.1 TMEM175 family protein [Dermatobacter hominis]
MSDADQERGLERLILFSDAVVAIAITLLVLPLLDLADHRGSLADMFSDGGSQIMVFFISFLVVASFWVNHRELFEGIDRSTAALTWMDVLWLMTIAFLPFPTEVLGVHGPDGAGVRAFYIGSLLACSVAQLLLSLTIMRTPRVWRDGKRPEFSLNGSIVSAGLFAAIFVVATFVPAIGLWALFGLFLLRPISGWLDRRTGATT